MAEDGRRGRGGRSSRIIPQNHRPLRKSLPSLLFFLHLSLFFLSFLISSLSLFFFIILLSIFLPTIVFLPYLPPSLFLYSFHHNISSPPSPSSLTATVCFSPSNGRMGNLTPCPCHSSPRPLGRCGVSYHLRLNRLATNTTIS